MNGNLRNVKNPRSRSSQVLKSEISPTSFERVISFSRKTATKHIKPSRRTQCPFVLVCHFSSLPKLNALIESHMKELRQRSISCTCLSRNDADQDGAYNGDYSFVFANPEALVLNEKWRNMIQMSIYQTSLFGIAVDEAHVILYICVSLFVPL